MANNLLVPNVFYTAEQYVDPVRYTTPQTALVDEKLIYPLIKDAGNYQLAIGKAEIPLDTIPLTRSNIPLKRYEVTLRQGNIEASAYLRQLNASSLDFLWNCSPAGVVNSYNYTVSGSIKTLNTIDCSPFVPNGVSFFCVDDYRNAYFATSSIAGGLVNTIIVVNLETIEEYASLTATLIQGMDLDRSNKLYVADETNTGSVVKVYNNNNSATEVILSLLTTITEDYAGNQLTNIRTICADQTLLVGYEDNKFSLYNLTTFVPYTGFTNTTINHLGRASSLNSSGQGTFVVVDDNTVNGLFLSTTSLTSSANLYNTYTGDQFGEPTLTGVWLPTTKFALTDNGYGFGIGTDNNLYVFGYNNQTAQVTSNASLIPSPPSQTYGSCCCSFRRTDMMITGKLNNKALYGFNLDNQGNNNIILFDSEFKLGGGTAPLSWDFQPNSMLSIGISQFNNNLYRTNQPNYPKDFFQNINTTGSASIIKSFGVGWNDQGGNTATVYPVNSNGQAFSFIDMCSLTNGNLFGLGSIGSSNVVRFVNFQMNGTFTSSFVSPYTTADGLSCVYITGSIVAVLYEDGTIQTIDSSTGTVIQTFGTTFTIDNQYLFTITGGFDNTQHRYVIIATNGYNIQVFISPQTPNPTFFTSQFTSNSLIPNGQSTAQFIYGSHFFGSGFDTTPTLYLLTNGTNTTSPTASCQALVKVAFEPLYTGLNLANTIQLTDNQHYYTPITNTWTSTMSSFYKCNELYIPMGEPISGAWNNQLTAYNTALDITTSTMTFPTPSGSANLVAPPLYFEVNGDSNYYTWNPITHTGVSGTLLSISCSRNNPNTIYVLDNTGTVYTGNLPASATSVVFKPLNVIDPDTNWQTISVFPDAVAYDSFVSSYTISNQQPVSPPIHYQNLQIPSIARNDVSANYSVSVKNSQVDFYNSSTFVNTGTFTLPTANLIYTKAGEDIDAGNVDILNFQVFIDALNVAFAEAYTRLKNNAGSLTEAPTASINFTNQLFTLAYSSDYTQSGNGILFNAPLLRIVNYYAVPDTLDVGFYRLVLPPNSTSWQQTNKSAYKFNKLNKILFQSTTLYVSGSFVGINAQNQTVTDVDVITDNYIDNLGQTLYYQPNFLRPFVLGSNNPIDRVQLSILYSYIDGTQYALTINPDDGWSVLFDFIRKS